MPIEPRYITQAHLDEWINGSAVTEMLTRQNLVSIDNSNEIARLLRWKSYRHTPGWYVLGVDVKTGQHKDKGQFKSDAPIQFPDDDKPQKYLTFPKGTESEIICLVACRLAWSKVSERYGVPINPDDIDESRVDLGFWRWVLKYPTIPILITEGVKKAACLLSHGYVAIALTGVWNGQRQKKLTPTLVPFVVPGRPVVLVFDADIIDKESVQDALRILGHLLHKAKAIVSVALWDLNLGKGVDDFIVAQGEGEFKKVLEGATPYSEWLKKLEGQFSPKAESRQKDTKPPEPIVIAAELVEKYRTHLAWNVEVESWFRYEGELAGVWAMEHDVVIEGVIQAELDADQRTAKQYSYSYLTNVIKLMRPKLLVRQWDNSYSLGIVPLVDGVLHLKTMELKPHAPGYRLTWALPYAWKDRGVGCQPIQDWLLETMQGDRDRAELLRAYLNAVVTGRVDLERFIECIGPGGTGKSTYIRLAKALVGERNTFTTELKHLEQNRFESSGVYGKRLVIITDSERYGGNVTTLKAITGEDSVRYERKFIQQGNGFTPQCMVIIAANEQIQSADYTSGLERRRLTIPFLNEVAPENRRNLIGFRDEKPHGIFMPYLPGLLAWVLEMPDDRVTELVQNTAKSVPSLNRIRLESLCQTIPLADWMDNCIVYRLGAKTYVGIAKRDKSPDSLNTYQFVNQWLYANYCEYAVATGHKAVSQNRFSSLLEDLCRSQLKLEGVYKGKDRRGSYFEGLAIRKDGDSDRRPVTDTEPPGGMSPNSPDSDRNPPSGSNTPASGDGNPPPCDGSVMACDGSVMAENLASDGCDGCDGFFQFSPIQNFENEKKASVDDSAIERDMAGPSYPSQLSETPSQQRFSPSQQPSPSHHTPSPSHHNPSPNPAADSYCIEVLIDGVWRPATLIDPVSLVQLPPYQRWRVRLTDGSEISIWGNDHIRAIAPDRLQQPQQPTTVDILTLEIGDSVRDSSGRVTQIAKVAKGGWATADGNHVSRDDLKFGTYTKVAPTHSELTPAEASASILIDFDIDDPQAVLDLTQEWTEEHKREVWQLLTPELRQKYRDLMKTAEGRVSDRNE